MRELQRNTVPVAERLEEFARRVPLFAYSADGSVVTQLGQVPASLSHPQSRPETASHLPREIRQQRLLETRHV
jgi:hypothetical protein